MRSPIISEHIVLNGKLLPVSRAHISIFNQALFSSFGVYESIEVDAGVCFHLEDHLERLQLSAEMIELPLQHELSAIQSWIEKLVEADQIHEALLRLLVFGPSESDDTLIYVVPGALPHYPSTFYTQGAAAITYHGQRALPQAKTFNTLVNYLAQRKARRAGVHEAFLVDQNHCLTEGSRSNLFVISEGKLITPPAAQVLSGITRDQVCRLASELGLPVVEAPIPLNELSLLDELFVTSTSMHIIPIIRVDQQPIGNGEIGPLTHALMGAFEAYYAGVMGRRVITLPQP